VTVSATGYIDRVYTLTLAPGEDRTLTASMTQVAQAASLTVVAVDAASPSTVVTPSHVTVSALSDGSSSDQTSGFAFTDLSAGGYRVTVSATGYIDRVYTLTLAPGEDRTLTASMTQVAQAASLTVVAVDAASPSTVVTPTSIVVALTADASSTLSPSSGIDQFTDVNPGSYRVTVSAAGYVDRIATLTLAAGENRTLTVSMTSNANGSVKVTLRDPNGSTVGAAGASFFLVDSTGATLTSCSVPGDDNSSCVFASVPAGAASVTVSATNYLSVYESITVNSASSTSAIVVLGFDATMTIYATTNSGATRVGGLTVGVDGTGKSCVTAASGADEGKCSISGLDPQSSPTITVTDGTTTKTSLAGLTLADGTWKNTGVLVAVDWSA
jgi:glycine cleavage system H lipoate-binding protein